MSHSSHFSAQFECKHSGVACTGREEYTLRYCTNQPARQTRMVQNNGANPASPGCKDQWKAGVRVIRYYDGKLLQSMCMRQSTVCPVLCTMYIAGQSHTHTHTRYGLCTLFAVVQSLVCFAVGHVNTTACVMFRLGSVVMCDCIGSRLEQDHTASECIVASHL